MLKFISQNEGITNSKLRRKFKLSEEGMYNILKLFISLKLIRKEVIGREKPIYITSKGLEIYKELDCIDKRWK